MTQKHRVRNAQYKIQNYKNYKTVIQKRLQLQAYLCTLVMTLQINQYFELTNKHKGHSATGQGGPRGSGQVKTPDFLDVQHYKGGGLSAKRTGRLYPRRNPWYSLSEAESTSGHMVLSGGTTEKIPSDTTRNRSRDCPTSSAVPYATPGPN